MGGSNAKTVLTVKAPYSDYTYSDKTEYRPTVTDPILKCGASLTDGGRVIGMRTSAGRGR